MPNLILHGLHINQYNDREICAYITYIDANQQMVDHHGDEIGDSMQSADSFIRHLKNHVVSSINKRLQKFEYYIATISCENQVNLPAFIIARRDKGSFAETELASIRQKIESCLLEINEISNPQVKDNQRLFHAHHSSISKKKNLDTSGADVRQKKL